MKLIDKVRSCKILEDDTDLKLSILKKSPLELTDVDALRNNLKGISPLLSDSISLNKLKFNHKSTGISLITPIS